MAVDFDNHPTVRLLRSRSDKSVASVASEKPTISLDDLRQIATQCGADDCGLISIDDPAIRSERDPALACFPQTRTLLAIVRRMNRESVRSPQRSVANLEFHRIGHNVDETAQKIVRQLEDRNIPALNPAMAFPMELSDFPGRGWIISHKVVAQAAGLGQMGIHRSLIHPKFGSFILLGTVLIGADVETLSKPIDYNPCVECKLCVAACPVGAIKPDGYFDFSSCYTHNYQQFLGGFVNWMEDITDGRSQGKASDPRRYAETAERWQSLSYGPNYNAAFCLAVCPAGEDVIGPYLTQRKEHINRIVSPLQDKVEYVYVAKHSDAEDHVKKRYPHKRIRHVRSSGRVTTIENFITGMPLSFQPGKAGKLAATYFFTFTGEQQEKITVTIRSRKITVKHGHHGKPNLRVTADARTWVRFLNQETSIVWCLLTGRIRLRGFPSLLVAFGKCFPT